MGDRLGIHKTIADAILTQLADEKDARRPKPPIDQEIHSLLYHGIAKKWRDVQKVVYQGLIPSSERAWRVLCDHGNDRALFPVEDGDLPMRLDRPVYLGTKMGINLHAPISVLAGQCLECGRVHWVLLEPKQTRDNP